MATSTAASSAEPSTPTSAAAAAPGQGQQLDETTLFSCSVALSAHLRTLASALQCMAKMAKEVVLDASPEPERDGVVSLRCVNDAQTAFVKFDFRPEFFEKAHEWPVRPNVPAPVAVRIQLKACLSAFRSLRTTERLVISLVRVGEARHVVVFRAMCKRGVVKTHQFHYEEAQVVEAQFARDEAKHRLRARPALWVEALQHVRGSDEVALEAHAGVELRLGSHVGAVSGDAPPPSASTLVTEMRIPAQDFERFDVSEPRADVLFSLREMRAVLGFCENHLNEIQDLLLLFNDVGDPLLLTTSSTSAAPSSSSAAAHPAGGDGGYVGPVPLYSFSLVLSTLPPTAFGEPVGVAGAAPTASVHVGGTMPVGPVEEGGDAEEQA